MSRRIWQQGRVVSVDSGQARILLEPVNHCARCMSGQGCGAGVFSRLFARRSVELALPDRLGLEPGMGVQVGVSSAALAGACLRVYGLPLAGFVAGIMGVHGLMPDVPARDLLGLAAGFGLGLLLLVRTRGLALAGLEPILRKPGPACGSSQTDS